MPHDWQPDATFIGNLYLVDRCAMCGTYRARHLTADGKHIIWISYSPQDANISNTLRWRAEAPPCKQTEQEPQS